MPPASDQEEIRAMSGMVCASVGGSSAGSGAVDLGRCAALAIEPARNPVRQACTPSASNDSLRVGIVRSLLLLVLGIEISIAQSGIGFATFANVRLTHAGCPFHTAAGDPVVRSAGEAPVADRWPKRRTVRGSRQPPLDGREGCDHFPTASAGTGVCRATEAIGDVKDARRQRPGKAHNLAQLITADLHSPARVDAMAPVAVV